MILVFVATLEQVRIGIRGAQAEFFESMYGIWHYPEQFWGGEFLNSLPIPIPGGYLLGGLLILNLIAAFVTRFQWTGKKDGDPIYPPGNYHALNWTTRHSGDAGGVPYANQ